MVKLFGTTYQGEKDCVMLMDDLLPVRRRPANLPLFAVLTASSVVRSSLVSGSSRGGAMAVQPSTFPSTAQKVTEQTNKCAIPRSSRWNSGRLC